MADQFSGEMLVGLMRMVDRIASSPNTHVIKLGPEEAELERLRVLLGGSEETPLKIAMMHLIDRLKSDQTRLMSLRPWKKSSGYGLMCHPVAASPSSWIISS